MCLAFWAHHQLTVQAVNIFCPHFGAQCTHIQLAQMQDMCSLSTSYGAVYSLAVTKKHVTVGELVYAHQQQGSLCSTPLSLYLLLSLLFLIHSLAHSARYTLV